MMKVERDTIIWSKVNVDVYEDSRPKSFESYHKDDMDSGTHTDDVVIKLHELPPGALVTIEYPMCPDCGEARCDEFEHDPDGGIRVIGHNSTCDCGFDWIEWENDQFS